MGRAEVLLYRVRIIDAISHIRSHRTMYLPPLGDVPISLYLANRLSSDAMLLGASEVDVARVGNWWTVSADTDWLSRSSGQIEDLFRSIIPFPEAGPNSMRSEVLLTAFATDIVTVNAEGRRTVIKGSALRELAGKEATRPWARVLQFRVRSGGIQSSRSKSRRQRVS